MADPEGGSGAEQKRLLSAKPFGALFDNDFQPTLLIDPKNSAIVDANPAARAFYGYSKAQFVHLKKTDINAAPAPEVFAAMQDALVKVRTRFEFQHRLANGALRDVEEFMGPVSVGSRTLLCSIVRDLTDQRRKEQALLESQATLATTEHVAEVGTWQWDIVHNDVIWSEQLREIFGRACVTPARGYEDFMASVHADDKVRVRQAVDAALAGEKPLDVDFRIVRPDGAERVLNSRAQVFRDNSGKPVRMVGTAHDMTDRKRLEKTLQESEARYRTLFETSPDAVVVWDMNSIIQAANGPLVTLLGYEKAEDLIGKSWHDSVVAEDLQAAAEPIERAAEARRVTENEFRMRRKDGSTFFAQGRANPVLDAAGKPIYFIGAARDISERKRMEEALRASQAMLASAENIAQIGSWQWDLASNVHIWSEEQWRILGRAPNASPLKFEDLLACVHPDDKQRMREDADAVSSDGHPDDIEFRIIRPDGAERIIQARRQVYRNEAGRPIRVVGTIHDVTETRHRERELSKLHAEVLETVGKLQQGQRETALMIELNETMQTCNSREEAYPLIAATAQKLFSKANGALAIFASQGRDLKTEAEWGSGQWMASDFLVDDCWALRRGQPHYVGDPGRGALCHHFTSPPPGPYLCLPLAVRSETVGLLHFSVAAGEGIYEDQRRPLIAFGEIVKLSLSNLRLRDVLRDQSIHDPLTGLFNRHYLHETFAREVSRAQRQKAALSVAMFDIDHFKMINDTYGHEAGDEVLRELGRLLREGVRASDIACRYGGEEFLLVLPDTDMTSVMPRLQGICRDIKRKQYACRGTVVPGVTVSVGLAQLPLHGTTPDELIRASDEALYAAKNAGRDRIEIFSGPRSKGPAPASPS